jgi:hypothetical protein
LSNIANILRESARESASVSEKGKYGWDVDISDFLYVCKERGFFGRGKVERDEKGSVGEHSAKLSDRVRMEEGQED